MRQRVPRLGGAGDAGAEPAGRISGGSRRSDSRRPPAVAPFPRVLPRPRGECGPGAGAGWGRQTGGEGRREAAAPRPGAGAGARRAAGSPRSRTLLCPRGALALGLAGCGRFQGRAVGGPDRALAASPRGVQPGPGRGEGVGGALSARLRCLRARGRSCCWVCAPASPHSLGVYVSDFVMHFSPGHFPGPGQT